MAQESGAKFTGTFKGFNSPQVYKAPAKKKKKAAPIVTYRPPAPVTTKPAPRTYKAPQKQSSSRGSKTTSTKAKSSGGASWSAQKKYNKQVRDEDRKYQEKQRQKEIDRQKKEKEKEQKKQDKKDAKATRKTVKALHKQVNPLKKSRKTALQNIRKRELQGNKFIKDAFSKLNAQYQLGLDANRKSEHDTSFANRANRARERGDILQEAASQGAGESDNLRAQAMALRNWSANQQEVNRAFHDTQQSTNQEIQNLNQNTRQNLFNLYGQSNVERAKVWDDYYSAAGDVWTQIFNAQNAQTANKQYKNQYKNADGRAAKMIGSTWKDPGVPKAVQNWQGQKVTEEKLNSSKMGLQQYGKAMKQAKPEGSTLRKW